MLQPELARLAILELTYRLAADADRLRELDAQLGDGDLGVTVELGCEAVRERLRRAEAEIESFDQLFQIVGSAFAGGNPSTMANFVRIALKAVAKEVGPVKVLPPGSWATVIRAAMDGIQRRGGANVGDKTILDALDGSLRRLEEDPAALATAVREGAERGAAAVVDLPSKIGRASWQGDRTRGVPDPGAELWVSIARILEGLTTYDDWRRPPTAAV